MVALAGFFVLSAQGGAENPYLAATLTEFDPDSIIGWPSGVSAVSLAPISGLSTHWPVEANGRGISGFPVLSYSDDYYHRIHIVPLALDLGNIVSVQTFSVLLWNSHFTPRTVTGVDGVEEGIEVISPVPLPAFQAALEEMLWEVSVSPDGPSVLDAVLTWQYTDADAPSLALSGNRIVPWVWPVDWSRSVTERLTWSTDIRCSRSGAEQRRALRISPRRSFDVSIIAEGAERAYIDLALSEWGASNWAIPIWPDVQFVESLLTAGAMSIPCSTADFDFRDGGLALLRGETAFDAEAVEIVAVLADQLLLKRPVQSSWPAGSRLYPVRVARLAEMPSVVRKTDQLLTMESRFDVVEPCDWPAESPLEMYRGRPVLSDRPDESTDLTHAHERLLETLDNVVGIPAVHDSARRGFQLQQHRWALDGRRARAAWRSFIYGLRGMQKSIWVPTHADDVRLSATASAKLMPVFRIGYARFGGGLGRRDLCIELLSGARVYARVTGAIVDGASEILTLDQELENPIAPEQVARISWLGLFRLATDEVVLEHVTDAAGVARAELTWRGVRDDLEAP